MTLPAETPFNIIRDVIAVHFFTKDEVTSLLQQFAQSYDIVVDPAVASDVFELTAGHAGLACACGRALETVSELRSLCSENDGSSSTSTPTSSMLRPRIHISLKSWIRWRVSHIVASVSSGPTVQHMADSFVALPALALAILERAILAGDAPVVVDAISRQIYVNAVRLLAGDGWLRPLGALDAEHQYVFTSPLVRTIAMNKLAAMRSPVLPQSLPPLFSGVLNAPAIV